MAKVISRRGVLRTAGAVAAAAPLGILGSRVFAANTAGTGTTKTLKLAWNAGAICTAAAPVAQKRGIFAKNGLNVEFVNFGGSTEQLLEAIATGKADAGIGMALRWLKPLEQGFDVKLTGGVHGGCLRLLGSKAAGITDDLKSLKGKTIAISDQASPAKNFFGVLLTKQGLNPEKDVEWRVYPADLLALAVQKGEAQALADSDPRTFIFLKDDKLFEVASNLSGEYQSRSCCVIGVRGSLIRDDKDAAAALTASLLEAAEWVSKKPDDAAAAYAEYGPGNVDDYVAMLRSHTHHHHPIGADFKQEIASYADELKLVQVFKQSTNTTKFADRVYADVLT